MLIYPGAEHIKGFHDSLVEIYQGREFPKKIEPGYNYEGTINFIADFAIMETLFGYPLFPHTLQKAAVYLYYLNSHHPFTDGNKRTSLVTTYYFLLWNGYYLSIPPDADKFLIKIADLKYGLTLNDAYQWIIKHSRRKIVDILRNWYLSNLYWAMGLFRTPFFGSVIDILSFYPVPKFVLEAISYASTHLQESET